jgi:hypothetical protein
VQPQVRKTERMQEERKVINVTSELEEEVI